MRKQKFKGNHKMSMNPKSQFIEKLDFMKLF